MDRVRDYYEFMLAGFPPSDNYKRCIRAEMKSCCDSLSKTLMEEERCRYSEDGESVTYYGIVRDYGETDEEIQEWIDEMEVHNTSPYDCSGKLCTAWISWKRTPSGISVVHHMVLDV